jgi:hypothetical protein
VSRPLESNDNPPVTLEEVYGRACTTSDLGLPIGDGAGAQGILAAAAWSEVHLGSALRRLRTQWDRERPVKRIPRPVEVLRAAGLSRDEAREVHRRERITFNAEYAIQRQAVQLRVREFRQVLDHLTMQAATWGIERPDVRALDALGAWLDDPRSPADSTDAARLLTYINDCLNRARQSLRLSMRGRTNHCPDRSQKA